MSQTTYSTGNGRLLSACICKCFSTGITGSPAKHQICPDGVALDSIDFTLDVTAVLKNLDPNSSMGPDWLHAQLLKYCSETLAYPPYKIFQRSLSEGSLPQEWKTSIVIPIFKKGSRYNPLNYRPVSLTSVPGKCLERLICRRCISFLPIMTSLPRSSLASDPANLPRINSY